MAKIIQVTQPDGNAALVNAEAVSLVLTPNPNLGFHPSAKAVIYVGDQHIAVTEPVAQIKALLWLEPAAPAARAESH